MPKPAIKTEAPAVPEAPAEHFHLLRQLCRFAGREAVLVFRRSTTPASATCPRMSSEEVERLKASGAAGRYHAMLGVYVAALAAHESLIAEFPEREAEYLHAAQFGDDTIRQSQVVDDLRTKIRNSAARIDLLCPALVAARNEAAIEHGEFGNRTRNERLAAIGQELTAIEAKIVRVISPLLDEYLAAKQRFQRYDDAPLPPLGVFLAPMPERPVNQPAAAV